MEQTKTHYSPCFKCREHLELVSERTNEQFREKRVFFKRFRSERSFTVSPHGQEKADLKKIDFSQPHEIEWASTGKVIEIQKGKKRGEIKFIVMSKRFDEQMHYVFLLPFNTSKPVLINVYNPQEGMSFKWDKKGQYRKFLNTFRDCCPHPDDHQDNFFKQHHGRRHKLYPYQIEHLNQLNEQTVSH